MPENRPAADRLSMPVPGLMAPLRSLLVSLGTAGRRLAALLLIVLLLLAGTFAGLTSHDHSATLEEGWADVERAALGTAVHAEQSLGAARLVTDRVVEGILRDGHAAYRGAGQVDLAAMLRHAPQIGSLLVLDAQGRLVASSLDPDPPPADLSGQPHFARLQGGEESHLSPLSWSRTRLAWCFSYDRAVRDRMGEFRGIVQAALHAEDFQHFLRGLGLGPGGVVGLFRADDGAPLMRFPLPALAGPEEVPPPPPAAWPELLRAVADRSAPEGRFEHRTPAGERLLVAWRLGGEGGAVLAAATLPRAQALEQFRARLARNALLFGLAGTVLAGLGVAVAAALARGRASRREAEAGQRELAAVLEATGEGVVVLDPAWRIRFLNTRAAHALAAGVDLTGHPLWEALPELVGGPIWQACERTMEGRGPARAEARLASRGLVLRAESHPRGDGGIIVFLRDVTAERAADARLAESEARLRRVLDNLFVFVGVLTPDGTLLEANRAPLEAGGLTLEDVRGRRIWDCYWFSHDPEVQRRLREACARAAAGEASRYDIEVRMAGDTRMTIDFQIAPLRDAAGRVTHLIPSGTDVTARRKAEAALAESEARLRLAQEAAEVGVFEFDNRTRQAYWSAAMFRLYGLDPSARSPLIEEAEFLALLHPEDREVQRARRDALWADHGKTRFRFEFRIRRPDTGEVRWIASRGEVVRDAAGRPLLMRGVNYDTTERRRAEERQMLLAREVDHRAKNALAVVQAIVGLTRNPDPGQFRAAVTGRIAAMARAHTLLAREGWGSAELRELIEEEVAPHRGGAAAGGAERVTLEGPRVALAPGAAQPLAMALHELATNAVKYGALSCPGGQVAIGWKASEAGGLTLRWTERGGPALAGPPERRGFGSSVIRNTVERQLGGRVEFDWRPGGLECRLTLPPGQLRWPEAEARREEAQLRS